MLCRRIQELLKTDYLDARLSPAEEQQIKEHLTQCPRCRRLEEELQAERRIFQNASRQQVPEHIWQNIRDTIITGRLNQERETKWAPRPAFALASIFAFVILVAIFAGNFIQKKQVLSRQNDAEVVAAYSLNNQNGYLLDDLGTDIEEYFL